MEEFCEHYIPHFLAQGVNGKQLLCLSHTDLERCNVTKLGHQEVIMEALECLVHLVGVLFSFSHSTIAALCSVFSSPKHEARRISCTYSYSLGFEIFVK